MTVQHHEGRFLFGQMADHRDERAMLYRIREIPRMKGMAIIHFATNFFAWQLVPPAATITQIPSCGDKMDRDPEVQALLDKQAIYEVIVRYCRGVDRLDRKLLESVYWPEATDDHGTYNGPASGFIDRAMVGLADMIKTQHFIGNCLIELDSPTRAHAETYVNAYHQVKTRFGAEEYTGGGRCLDTFEKRGKEWRFLSRTVCIDYSLQAQASDIGRHDSARNKGGRYPDDPVYRLFG